MLGDFALYARIRTVERKKTLKKGDSFVFNFIRGDEGGNKKYFVLGGNDFSNHNRLIL